VRRLVLASTAFSLLSVLLLAGTSDTTTLQGFVTDTSCAARGKKTCSDRSHVTEDNPLVLVSDSDATIYTLLRPGRLAKHQGEHVEVKGVLKRAEKTIAVQDFKTLD